MAPWVVDPDVVTLGDDDGLAVEEGVGHLGPGSGKESLHRAPGDAHADAGLLLREVKEVA
jgi:hypothetical protein